MSPRTWVQPAVLAVLATAVLGLPAWADVKTDTALARVPADSAFFATFLRNKEQLDLLTGSRAYQTLVKLPVVQMAWKQALAGLGGEGGPLEALQKFTRDRELIELLQGALADEVFVWGGKGWTDLLTVYSKYNGAQQIAPYEALLPGADPEKAMMRGMLLPLLKNRERIVVPSLVVGFKVKEPRKVAARIKALHKTLAKQLDEVAILKGKLRVQGDFLTLPLDSSLVPWGDFNANVYEEKKGEFEPLMNHLKKLTAAISLGVQDDYLLLGLTPTLAELENLLGKGKPLAQRDELRVLDAAGSKKITTVGYVGKEFRAVALGDSDRGEMIQALKRLVDKGLIKANRKAGIKKDADELLREWNRRHVPPGTWVWFSYLSDSGYESYSHDFGNHDHLKGVKLGLADHLGGNPLFAFAFAYPVDGSDYAWLRKWAQKAYQHGEAVFLDLADDAARDVWKQNVKTFLPLVKQLDQATGKLLLPSLSSSGFGVVVDARWTSKQWVKDLLPASAKPLPMLEVGLLAGIRDDKKFAAAIKEYRTTLNELYEKLQGIEGLPNKDNLPDFKIPAPDPVKGKGGQLFTWKLPEDSGLDKQVVVTLGVGKDVSVLTASTAHAEWLLAKSKLVSPAGALPGKGGLVGLVVLNAPALVDAALPWVETSLTMLAAGEAEAWVRQARQAARALKCFHGVTSGSYLEEGRLVTHSRWRFRDLPRE